MHRVFTIILALIVLSIGSTATIFFLDSQDFGKITWTQTKKGFKEATSPPLRKLNFEELTVEEELAPVLEEQMATETPTTTPEEVLSEPVEKEKVAIENTIPPLPEAEPEPPSTIEETPLQVAKDLTFGDINNMTRDALVNIFCLTKGPHATITPISGSGTIIDPRGVILTNSHIAQYFLLKDYPTEGFVNCLIRTGSPAKASFKASLLYLSPPWVEENAKAIVTENPVGTGEHDFALLLIDESLTGSPLPSTFSYLEFDTSEGIATKDDDILIGAYPAGFLGGKTIQESLYASTALTTIREIFTFDLDDGYLDVIALGGSVVAQQGSSGGAVVNAKGKIIGLISTSSDGETTADRDLRAISLEHIERSLLEHNKTTLDELLSGDLTAKATAFSETAAPTLLQIIISSFLNL